MHFLKYLFSAEYRERMDLAAGIKLQRTKRDQARHLNRHYDAKYHHKLAQTLRDRRLVSFTATPPTS